MKVKLLPHAFPPERAHPEDAGMDLKAMYGDGILPGASKVFDTGVCMEILPGCFGMVANRSGLNIKHGIVCSGVGIVDEGYTGSIKVKLYNLSDETYVVNRGDKIAQLIIIPCEKPKLEFVERLDDTERGDSGFGSTGR